MNSANQPINPINQNGQNTPKSQNNQMNSNQMSPKEIEPVHYPIQRIEVPNESVKPVVPEEKAVYTYDDSSEYSSYSSCSESLTSSGNVSINSFGTRVSLVFLSI